jgi:hypothetical protein
MFIKDVPFFCHFLRHLPTLVLFCLIFSYIPKIGHPTLANIPTYPNILYERSLNNYLLLNIFRTSQIVMNQKLSLNMNKSLKMSKLLQKLLKLSNLIQTPLKIKIPPHPPRRTVNQKMLRKKLSQKKI